MKRLDEANVMMVSAYSVLKQDVEQIIVQQERGRRAHQRLAEDKQALAQIIVQQLRARDAHQKVELAMDRLAQRKQAYDEATPTHNVVIAAVKAGVNGDQQQHDAVRRALEAAARYPDADVALEAAQADAAKVIAIAKAKAADERRTVESYSRNPPFIIGYDVYKGALCVACRRSGNVKGSAQLQIRIFAQEMCQRMVRRMVCKIAR